MSWIAPKLNPILSMTSYALSNDKMLVGFNNIDEWKELVFLGAIAQGLEDYLTTDYPATREHRINKAKLSFTIKNSISSQIRQQLVETGWSSASLDPKALFDKISDILPDDDNFQKLGREFRTISPDRFDTLLDFKAYISRRGLWHWTRSSPRRSVFVGSELK